MLIEEWSLALLSGGLVGLSLGMTGGGGSLMAIPLLVYVLGRGVREAVVMSLALVGTSALIGVLDFRRTGEVKVRAAVIFSVTGAIGTWIGAYLHLLVRPEITLVLFGLLMAIVAVAMWLRGHMSPSSSESQVECADRFPRACVLKLSGIGASVGVLTGFFGVGGGFVIVPSLTLVLGFPIRVAVGTSLLIIAFISLTGLAGHVQFGGMDGRLLALLMVGGAMGMVLGARMGRFVSAASTTKTFAGLAITIGLLLIVHNVVKLVVGIP